MRQNTKRGFTLIELLIVVAIIGLLASIVLIGLQGTRRGARDTRRAADMHTVQLALETYFNKCSLYPIQSPSSRAPNDCAEVGSGEEGVLRWATGFGQELMDSGFIKEISELPQDPLLRGQDPDVAEQNLQSYQYLVSNDLGTGYGYILKASMEETAGALLQSDIDGNQFYNYALECGDNAADEFEYCIGSSEGQ